MEISNTMLTDAVLPPEILPGVKDIESAPEQQKQKIAKDFESLLIGKLLDEMGDTIGESDEDSAAFGQVKGIFNMQLARYLADNGGFGLAAEVYESLSRLEEKGADQIEAIDKQI